MTTISIIGSGNMAAAIGTRAAKRGHTVELMGRDPARARALADQIGNGATAGTFGARPAGDIVVLAVLHTGAVDVVTHYGDALAGRILVDITNPFNADVTGLVSTPGGSVSQQIAAAPEGTHVVKAFNTVFRRRPLTTHGHGATGRRPCGPGRRRPGSGCGAARRGPW